MQRVLTKKDIFPIHPIHHTESVVCESSLKTREITENSVKAENEKGTS